MNANTQRDYEHALADVYKLITEIQDGVKAYDRRNARFGNVPHYGHVGDLAHYAAQLRDVADSLHNRGEYAEED